MKKNIDVNVIKHQLFLKYSSYDIPNNILEDIFEKTKEITDEMEIVFCFKKKADEYIVKEIQNSNIDMYISVVDNHKYLLKMIAKNKKYDLPADELYWFYEEAIELLKTRYNKYQLLSNNIIGNMKFLITKEKHYLENDHEIFDMTFFKKYIELYEIDKTEYATILGYSVDKFQQILDGKIRIGRFDIGVLCTLFNVNSYKDLKQTIKEKCEFFIKKEKLIQKQKEIKIEKPIEKIITKKEVKVEEPIKKKEIPVLKVIDKGKTKYNLSFLKEYVILYNIPIDELAEKLHCGMGKINDILEGKLLINESIIDDIVYEFNAKDINDLYIKINEKIESNEKTLKYTR